METVGPAEEGQCDTATWFRTFAAVEDELVAGAGLFEPQAWPAGAQAVSNRVRFCPRARTSCRRVNEPNSLVPLPKVRQMLPTAQHACLWGGLSAIVQGYCATPCPAAGRHKCEAMAAPHVKRGTWFAPSNECRPKARQRAYNPTWSPAESGYMLYDHRLRNFGVRKLMAKSCWLFSVASVMAVSWRIIVNHPSIGKTALGSSGYCHNSLPSQMA